MTPAPCGKEGSLEAELAKQEALYMQAMRRNIARQARLKLEEKAKVAPPQHARYPTKSIRATRKSIRATRKSIRATRKLQRAAQAASRWREST